MPLEILQIMDEGSVAAEEHSPVSRLRGARHQWTLKIAHRSSELNAFWSISAKSEECGAGQRYDLGLVSC